MINVDDFIHIHFIYYLYILYIICHKIFLNVNLVNGCA
jgi:hypothetical protein